MKRVCFGKLQASLCITFILKCTRRDHIDVAVYLSAQGLAFQGHAEDKSSSNRGNFLELIDLLGCYCQELRVFLDK